MSRIKAVFVSLYHCSLVVLNIYLLDFIFSSSEGGFLAVAPAVALGIAKMGASGIQMIQQDAAQKAATIEAGRLGRSIANRRFINKFAALQAPTKGTEMLMERVMRQSQAATEASKEAGARGVIGGTGRTVQGVTDAGAQIAARLDDLQLRLDNKFLTEEQRIGLMNERKDLQLDYQRLAGAQGAATAAGTASNQALAGLIGGAGETIAGGIAASDLYRGNQEIDVTDTTIDTTTNVNTGSNIDTQDLAGTSTNVGMADGSGPAAMGSSNVSGLQTPAFTISSGDLKLKALNELDPSVMQNYKLIQKNQPEMTIDEFVNMEALRLNVDLNNI